LRSSTAPIPTALAFRSTLRPSASGSAFTQIQAQNNGAGGQAQIFKVYSGSAVVTWLTANPSKAIQLNGYGAGTLTTDASGNVTASSDEA
jgi:hypothetical protein